MKDVTILANNKIGIGEMRTNHVELTFTIKRMTFGRRGSFEETTFHIRQSNTFDTKEREREREREKSWEIAFKVQPLERSSRFSLCAGDSLSKIVHYFYCTAICALPELPWTICPRSRTNHSAETALHISLSLYPSRGKEVTHILLERKLTFLSNQGNVDRYSPIRPTD